MSNARIGARVSCRDGWAGTVTQLVYDPATGQTTHLVMEVDRSHAHVVVPVGQVTLMSAAYVFLELTSQQLVTWNEGQALQSS